MALSGPPRSYITFLESTGGKRLLKVWRAVPEAGGGKPGTVVAAGRDGMVVACGHGCLRILEVQPEARKRMHIRDFLAGNPAAVGQVFS